MKHLSVSNKLWYDKYVHYNLRYYWGFRVTDKISPKGVSLSRSSYILFPKKNPPWPSVLVSQFQGTIRLMFDFLVSSVTESGSGFWVLVPPTVTSGVTRDSRGSSDDHGPSLRFSTSWTSDYRFPVSSFHRERSSFSLSFLLVRRTDKRDRSAVVDIMGIL